MAEKKLELNEEQKHAVNIDRNAVVSAGAGSGKTRVLSERYADLIINHGYKVDEILTLTFTKKATTEMSSRIYKTLKEKAPEAAKDFYKAQIRTLDSYSSAVAKLGANFYGVNPDFVVDKDGTEQMIHEMALPFILEHHDNKAMQAVAGSRNFQQKTEALFADTIINFSTLTRPVDFKGDLENQKNYAVNQWNILCGKYECERINLRTAFENIETNRNTKFGIAVAALLEKYENEGEPESVFVDLKNFDWQKMVGLIQTTYEYDSKHMRLSGGESWNETKAVVNRVRSLTSDLISLYNFFKGFHVLEEIVVLLTEFQNRVNVKKRTGGFLSYRDVNDLALQTLIDHPEIRRLEKQRYREILIDEFQDNNGDQRDLLFLLAEKMERNEKSVPSVEELMPNKLFFVGDEKQSIYRFRGADVTVFRRLKEEFSSGYLEMNTNYRSDPQLISAFNTIFGAMDFALEQKKANDSKPAAFLLPDRDEILVKEKNYEAVYNSVLIPEDKKNKADEKYPVKVHFALANNFGTETKDDANDEQSDDKDISLETENEACWVARKIKELKNTGKIKSYREVAILLRSYSSQPTFERVMLREGVPYSTETIKGFFSDGPVNDLVNFLRLCVYSNDSRAYASVLRSPFVGLSVDEANVILTDVALNDVQEPFGSSGENLLCRESALQYQSGKKLYFEIKDMLKYSNLTDILSKLWYECGYRYETLWNRKVEMYNRLYDMLFELARQADDNSSGAAVFVDGLRTYFDQSEKLDDMDIPLEKKDTINILTIHKSKGLEWPVVFVCDVCRRGAFDSNKAPTFFSKTRVPGNEEHVFGLCINTPKSKEFSVDENYIYKLGKEENNQQTAAELRRLTYVALTRAINELYITGFYKKKEGLATLFNSKSDYSPDNICGKELKRPLTIFNVLQPVFLDNTEPVEGAEDPNTLNVKSGAPFDFELIPYSYDLTEEKSKIRSNTTVEKKSFIEEAEPLFAAAEPVQMESIPQPYCNPSHLYEGDDESEEEERRQDADPNAPYNEINKIVSGAKGKFSYADFGTIAHAYLESKVGNTPVDFPSKVLLGLEDNSKAVEGIKSICQKMADSFVKTPLGKTVSASEWKKPEYEFRCKIGDRIIKGIIDLVFKNDDGSYTIVDYKTNSRIEPEKYFIQLACYRYAVASMLGVEEKSIGCKLFYLRFNEERDITENCNGVDLEAEIKNVKE